MSAHAMIPMTDDQMRDLLAVITYAQYHMTMSRERQLNVSLVATSMLHTLHDRESGSSNAGA